MALAIIAIGLGLIIALGGAIQLVRDRHHHTPRAVYLLSTVCGLAVVVAGFLAF